MRQYPNLSAHLPCITLRRDTQGMLSDFRTDTDTCRECICISPCVSRYRGYPACCRLWGFKISRKEGTREDFGTKVRKNKYTILARVRHPRLAI